MRCEWQRAAFEAAARVIDDHAAVLTELDAAIGDGDHGTNLQRGFAAIRAQVGELAEQPLSAALHKAGMTLVMTVGGASGPLYGSLLMAMGKAAAGADAFDAGLLQRMVAAGVAAVKARGRSDVGAKTMLDVLVPVERALDAAVAAGAPAAEIAARVRAAADEGLEATRPMRATKGRASFLGERSIGHLDPGAMSSCLLVREMCALIEAKP
ncbi:MAG: dihydroxyacetone kinase subunit L [Rhodospirillaceae bacterium]|nr:dihydroxyacetone kinase subunit L [Rhodospirillaceae bacterium]